MSDKKLVSPYFVVSANEIKQNTDATIAMIMEKLGTGCKPTNALDIQAAGIGAKDYQTLKGLLDKNHYTVELNMGTYSNPFIVSKDVGFFENDAEANWEAEQILANCEQVSEWKLLKNGKKTHRTVSVSPSTNGLYANIHAFGDTMDDLVYAIESAKDMIASGNGAGQNSNDSGEYSFECYGDELELQIYDSIDTPEYALVDDNGWVLTSDECSNYNVKKSFEQSDELNFIGDLKLLKQADIHEFVDDEKVLFALDNDGAVYHMLNADEILEAQKDKDSTPVHIFEMLDTKR